jgi:hypothetical protein
MDTEKEANFLFLKDILSQIEMNSKKNLAVSSGRSLQKHAGFALPGEGRVVRKPCERLSGHDSSPPGEESEASNRAAFASLGQKRRAEEPLCLSCSNGFLKQPA